MKPGALAEPLPPAAPGMMWAARLHGAQRLAVEQIARPDPPAIGEVLLRIDAVGICGSDLHSYLDGAIGDTAIASPMVLGHEFAATVMEAAREARDGDDLPLLAGARVAVDPAIVCHRCEWCQKGHPNLCSRLRFCGLWPHPGALSQYLTMPAENCFQLPELLDASEGVMLEPLGIALHALDLGRPRLEEWVAVLGAGPIGLLIIQLLRLAGLRRILVSEPLPWRAEQAVQAGARLVVHPQEDDPVAAFQQATEGRGVDLVFEAAWADDTVAQAAEIAAPGARLVLVGIPQREMLQLPASAARRKGLTVRLCRRMKLAYPRARSLAERGELALRRLVTHRYPLSEAGRAFEENARYMPGLIKAVVTMD